MEFHSLAAWVCCEPRTLHSPFDHDELAALKLQELRAPRSPASILIFPSRNVHVSCPSCFLKEDRQKSEMAGEDSSREIASLAGELQEYSSDPNQNTASNRSKIIQTARKLQCLAEGPEEYLNRLRFQVKRRAAPPGDPYPETDRADSCRRSLKISA